MLLSGENVTREIPAISINVVMPPGSFRPKRLSHLLGLMEQSSVSEEAKEVILS